MSLFYINRKSAASRSRSLMLLGSAVVLAVFLAQCGGKGEQSTGPAVIRTIVSHSSGDVQVEREGAKQPVEMGMELQPLDFLVTGADSSVDLAVTGYGVVKIGAGSRVQVETLSKSASGSEAQLRVERGSVASFVGRREKNANYRVATPTAIAGVRGTSFLLSVDDSRKDPRVKIAVLDGAVGVQMPGSQEEIVLEKNSQMTIDGFRRINRQMVRPLSDESLKEIKRLAVFQKSNVLEFNTLLDDIKQSSPELQVLAGDASADTALDDRSDREAREGGLDSVRRADRADISKTLKRDTQGDPIKLEPTTSYN